MATRLLLVALLLVGFARHGESGNILVVLPVPSYSHTVPFMPVLKELVRRGHNLTLISPFPQDSLPQGFHQIKVTNMSAIGAVLKKQGFNGGISAAKGIHYEVFGILSFLPYLCRAFVEPIKTLLPPTSSKFDLIIIEAFFGQEALAALGHIYKAPVVTKHPGPLTPIVADVLGNPNIESYTPNVRLKMSEDMTFLERVINFLISKVEIMYYHILTIPKVDQVMRELFTEIHDLPPLIDMLRNISLILIETHFSTNYQRPLLRNAIEIGGMGAKHVSPLPEDLEKILDEAKDGVIYLSWGSNFNDPNFDDTVISLMKTFSKLKQTVFFKWSNTSIPGVPENVVVRSWFPQTSILDHKNVVLYISHGGLNSINEAVYFGVPVVGTPIFADQPHNINILKHFGLAELVEFESIGDGVTLLNAITKVLSNPSYRENAKKRSAMLRDRPLPILEETAFWIEYVMKHGGDALRPASVHIPWYILMQLDVILFLSSIIISIIIIPILIIRKCRHKRIKTISKKKKQ